MTVDRKTHLKHLWISIEKNPDLLAKLEENNSASVDESYEQKQQYLITDDVMSPIVDEYYYDEADNCLNWSGELVGFEGKGFLSFSLPLSDSVLVDILHAQIKRMNKFKTVLETLKQ